MRSADSKIKAICISEKRGTPKYPIKEADITEDWGITGDAHGGKWHRQISLISYEKVREFADVEYGAFGENIVTEGIDLSSLDVGTRLIAGDVVLEITQIGKDCHSHCEIYKRMGDCIMPREGVFARVIKGGHIKVGDDILTNKHSILTVGVITLSDKSYRGEREDKSGPIIADMLANEGYDVVERLLLPDDRAMLENELIRLSDQRQLCLILTTGGTGFSQRDITPEATITVCNRMARGISEAMRAYSMTITKRAILSRGESGIRGKTLIVNLPGSPKAVKECLEYILPELKHGIGILRGTEGECGNEKK